MSERHCVRWTKRNRYPPVALCGVKVTNGAFTYNTARRGENKSVTCGKCVAQMKGKAMEETILQFFAYDHLPPHLQAVSQPFGELARKLVDTLPRNPERTVALRKLLEGKDAAVRALLFK